MKNTILLTIGFISFVTLGQAAVTIDSFDDPFSPITVDSSMPTAMILGQAIPIGSRSVTLEYKDGPLHATAEADGGILRMDSEYDTAADLWVDWEFTSSLDLTSGGDQIILSFLDNDLGNTGNSVAFSVTSGTSTAMIDVTSAIQTPNGGDVSLPFSDFSGVDFSAVSSMKLSVNGGAALDIELDKIYIAGTTSVPEPGFVGALFLASLGFVARRKRS